jgi:hypothetical protein
MSRFASLALAVALILSPAGFAASAPDDLADLVIESARKPITVDSLANDFAHLAKFVRHDAPNQVVFSDGGLADGHVRHAQARFDLAPTSGATANMPLFVVALELVEQPDFTFEGFAAALERRLGTPDQSSALAGATFRNWRLKQFPGRILAVARSQASDNSDSITIVQLIQER